MARSLKARRGDVTAMRRRLARLRRRLGAAAPPVAERSPLAPDRFPDLPRVGGLEVAAGATGTRYRGRPDLMMARLAPGTAIAGVFTRSATRSAAVLDCEAKIGGASDGPAAILVNAGNANAFTGRGGGEAVATLAARAAAATVVAPGRILTASTGVIGEPLPTDAIAGHLSDLAARLSPDGLRDAARAILTTDTFPKGAGRVVDMGGRPVAIAGIAKGSGMIAPHMATMLAFVFTDAAIGRDALQPMLAEIADETFNAITVDSDTSTSDTLLLAATGASGVAAGENAPFHEALTDVMRDLAHQIVRDGEGASKFVAVRVTGAADDPDARRVARAVAESPLVKTAIAGEDPNWGRIVMAVGKSGARADRDRLTIRFGEVVVARDGWRAPDYREADGAAEMRRDEVKIAIDLGLGPGRAVMWTCDLTAGYVAINADYRS